jgi:fatty aldehyde-generating acyl-ACP reductase
MKFATISHLLDEKNINSIPKSWIQDDIIVSPELDVRGVKGYVIALNYLPREIIEISRDEIRQHILKTALYAKHTLDIDIIQLGALTTSVTSGGEWLAKQKEYTGFVTHGDSYSAAVTCQAVTKTLHIQNKEASDLTIAIVGAYGIIGEAVSKLLVPDFNHAILIGRRKEKLEELTTKLTGDFETTTQLKTNNADVLVTATSHPTALLTSDHLKKKAIIIDVAQPPNVHLHVCQMRPDIVRIDGDYVEFPKDNPIPIPGLPIGKNFACFAEVMMQALEQEQQNHVGPIDITYLKKMEMLGEKYGFILKELTNFGRPIVQMRGSE